MRSSDLLERLQQAAPFSDRPAAERAIDATLRAFATAAPVSLRRALREALPSEFAHLLASETTTDSVSAAAFDAQVARHLGVPLGLATEQAETVCAVLGALVDPELRARLQRGLESELGGRFAARAIATAPAHAEHGTRSLATGRPGASQPFSEAAPGSQHPISSARPRGAQTGSVASEANPHGNTKLSSSHGTTQEREQETLAEGHNPGRE